MELRFTGEATKALKDLADAPNYSVKLKKVRKTLGLLKQNPRHPGLNSHKYQSVKSVDGSDLWESYIEYHTPGARRIFWIYGSDEAHITIVTIGPHPDSVGPHAQQE